MKTIIMAISPRECENIASRNQTKLVRKVTPKPPFKVVMYETLKRDEFIKEIDNFFASGRAESYYISEIQSRISLSRGKVIGEFIVDEVEELEAKYVQARQVDTELYLKLWRLTEASGYSNPKYVREYANGKPLKFINITDIKMYAEPKEISDYRHKSICEEYSKTIDECSDEDYRVPKMCKKCGAMECDGANGYSCYYCSNLGHKPITHAPTNYIYVADL